MNSDTQSSPLYILIFGILVGSMLNNDARNLEFAKEIVNLFAATYTICVLFILATIFVIRERKVFGKMKDSPTSALHSKSPQIFTETQARRFSTPEKDNLETISDSKIAKKDVPVAEEETGEQKSTELIDLNGSFRLEKNTNFQEFLAAQGVNWALRAAADKAITTHHITHQEHMLKIRVSGIISSETTYEINGPPVETKVKDRVYQDYVTYTDEGDGIKVTKINKEHNYTIFVVRKLSSDRQTLFVTSRAVFSDRNDVEAIQQYKRLNDEN